MRGARLLSLSGLFLLAADAGLGQASQLQPAFEVAAVRPSTHKADLPQLLARMPAVGEMRGGPGTDDQERISYTGVSLTLILTRAFGVQLRQISAPGWLDTQAYDIEAKVPPGATHEQLQAMLQNLLTERFGLVVHRETKEAADSAYDLVLAKSGPKLKRTAEPGPPKVTEVRDAGRLIVTFRKYSLADFAKWLGRPLANVAPRNGYGAYSAAHVLDDTGLLGEFDFTLAFASTLGPGGALRPALSVDDHGGQDSGGVDIFAAVERQLGLRLEQKKVPLDILVVDHIERVPSEN